MLGGAMALSSPLSALRTRLAHTLHQTAGGLPATYWYLWTGTLVNRLAGFVVPFLSLYLTQERGLPVEQATLIVSLHGAGSVIAGPVGGALADRVGRRTTLVAALWLGAAAMALLGFSRSPVHIAVATFLYGLLGEMYRPAVSAAVADLVPAQDRTRAYGLLYWVVNVGFAIALPLAGLMTKLGFTALFLADAFTTFLYGCIVLWKVPETLQRHADAPVKRSLLPSLEPFRDATFLAFALPIFLTGFIFFQASTTLSLDLTARGMTPATYGTVLALNGVLIVVLQPFTGQVVERMRRSSAMAWAAVLTGVGFGLHALPALVPLAMLAVLVWTLGEMAQAPVAPSVVADLAPPSLRGSYQGAYNMLWGLAACTAPALGGQVLARWGSHTLWGVCLLLGLFSGGWHLAIAGARRRRLEVLRQSRSDVSVGTE
jgi:MFS family permease